MTEPQYNPTDLAYLAGIIDGEGTVEVRLDPRKDRNPGMVRTCRVMAYNTDPRLTDWLETTFGGMTTITKENSRTNRRPVYRWHVPIAKRRGLWEQVRPYLRIKGEQLDLAFELHDLAITRCRGCRVPPGNVERRIEIVEEIKRLKWKDHVA